MVSESQKCVINGDSIEGFGFHRHRVSKSQLFGMETGWEDNQFEVYCSEIEIVQGMHQILGDKEMIVGEADSD